jgi:hypothetical protein
LGPKRLLYFFLNNIFNLKGNCAKKIASLICELINPLEGLLGGDGEDEGVKGSDRVQQVDGGIADSVVAVDVEKLTGRAVEAVEWHVVGFDCATTRIEYEARIADVGGRGRE